MTIAIYVHIYCTNVPGNSFLSKYFFFEKHNEINIKLEKNKKSHLSPANDQIDITDDHYDPFIHQQVEDYTAMNMQKYSNMPKKK